MRTWNLEQIKRVDFRILPIIAILMFFGLMDISSFSIEHTLDEPTEGFITPMVRAQLKWCFLGWGVYFFLAGFDYHKIREWVWVIYVLVLLSLIGLFFTDSIQRVHRWYRIPFIHISIQPSEYAKLAVVITLSWFLEKRKESSQEILTAFYSGLIVGIPFFLILKQPDLGTALILFPIALVLFYYGDLHPTLIKWMSLAGIAVLGIVTLVFSGIISHEEIRPYATKIIKSYQYDRISPDVPHQKASTTAIALGGVTGTGWRKGEFTGGGWLPKPYTDSVFPSFGEEFGFLGLLFLMSLFYSLIYFCFRVTAVAKDSFGRLLSAGISVYIAMHVLINVGMMCGLLPITGVPLILMSYGGSSMIATMAALGILQSIYTRRFMF